MHFGTAAWPRDKLKMSIKTPANCSSYVLSTSLGISSGIAAEHPALTGLAESGPSRHVRVLHPQMLEKANSSSVWKKNDCKIILYFAKKGGQILGLWVWCVVRMKSMKKHQVRRTSRLLTVLAKCFIH